MSLIICHGSIIIFIFTLEVCFCTSCNCTREKHNLYLSCNQPNEDEIQDCFEKNKGAINVYVTHSNLKRIPPSIRHLHRVQHLDLSKNYITEIDNYTLNSLRSALQILVMNHNNISVLRNGSLDNLTSLQEIYLANNGLQEIEVNAINSKLKSLHYMQFSNNQLKLLDIGLIWVPMLFNYTVNVSGNAISNFTNHKGIRVSDFKSKTSFRVDLQSNQITTIDVNYLLRLGKAERIWDLYNTGIGGINILYNRLICDCFLYPFSFYINFFKGMDDLNPVYNMRCAKPPVLSTTPIAKVSIHDFNCSVEGCPPQCQCTRTIALDLITVVCANDTLNTIPFELPNGKFINLSVHSRNVRELSDRTYFRNVTDLDLSSSSISTIQADFLPHLERMGTIKIYDNSLITLPEGIQNMNLENILSLYLHGNPFQCDCHTSWMKAWLQKNKAKIPDVDQVLCESGQPKGKPIIDALDSEFVCDGISLALVLAISFGGLSVIVIFLFTLYFFREPIKVLLIANYSCFQCLRRKVATNLPFDIFISYSSCDDTYVQDVLIPKLENDGFRLFTQDNFIPGIPITDNILKGIDSSFTTLIILSNKFLESDWCKYEFEQAYLKVLQEKERHLIILSLDNELNKERTPKTLTLYLKMNNYIKVSEKRYLSRLSLALPRIQARNEDSERTPLLQD
ncbi:hypothetical protein CHS0354_035562 [Potamilus streckersoni]|uniref:TIR domain-containing protein n=1 Tax=Potamilus streckersoni TaxID=2493646 RepID=A0AAE0RSW4_9BIVA|nr:hypothetical protein CHS0354_035562 [Potamilus streckersoni]